MHPNAMASRYTPEQRTEALELYVEHGPRAASRETGIPVATIGSWAAAEGRTFNAERTRQATETRKARLIEKLTTIAELGADIELELLETGEVSLRDVVGARTRAIHDLQLLTGEATGRTETRQVDDLDREIERLLAGHGAGG